MQFAQAEGVKRRKDDRGALAIYGRKKKKNEREKNVRERESEEIDIWVGKTKRGRVRYI